MMLCSKKIISMYFFLILLVSVCLCVAADLFPNSCVVQVMVLPYQTMRDSAGAPAPPSAISSPPPSEQVKLPHVMEYEEKVKVSPDSDL